MRLQRLVLDFRDEVLLVRALYETADPAVPAPGTKARTREVTGLVRAGLEDAIKALEGAKASADVVGTSGFARREDILSVALPHPYEARDAERASWGLLFLSFTTN